jgi:hypothetical protein
VRDQLGLQFDHCSCSVLDILGSAFDTGVLKDMELVTLGRHRH